MHPCRYLLLGMFFEQCVSLRKIALRMEIVYALSLSSCNYEDVNDVNWKTTDLSLFLRFKRKHTIAFCANVFMGTEGYTVLILRQTSVRKTCGGIQSSLYLIYTNITPDQLDCGYLPLKSMKKMYLHNIYSRLGLHAITMHI